MQVLTQGGSGSCQDLHWQGWGCLTLVGESSGIGVPCLWVLLPKHFVDQVAFHFSLTLRMEMQFSFLSHTENGERKAKL